MDLTANVIQISIELSACVCQECLAPHQIAVQSAALIRIVHRTEPVSISNAEILAWAHVDLMPFATFKTINQSANASKAMREILILAVVSSKVSAAKVFFVNFFLFSFQWLLLDHILCLNLLFHI